MLIPSSQVRNESGASTNRDTIAISNTRVRTHSDATTTTTSFGGTDRKLWRTREQSPSPSDPHTPSDTAHATDGPKVQLRGGRVHRGPLHVGGANPRRRRFQHPFGGRRRE